MLATDFYNKVKGTKYRKLLKMSKSPKGIDKQVWWLSSQAFRRHIDCPQILTYCSPSVALKMKSMSSNSNLRVGLSK